MKESENFRSARKILEKTESQSWLDGFDFSLFMQNLLISDGGYVIGTGNYENVNAEVAYRLFENIQKHPRIWKKYFMVA